jgi:pilus assembly protein CpaE
MLRAVMIAPDPPALTRLTSSLEARDEFRVVRAIDSYPPSVEHLTKLLRINAPDLVFLYVREAKPAAVVAEVITELAGSHVVTIHEITDPDGLLVLMRAGVREVLYLPLDQEEVTACLSRVSAALKVRPPEFGATDNVYCFLPSKPGGGATTIALNASLAAARIPNQQVLFCDLDLQFGMASFMLRLGSAASVRGALEYAHRLDEGLWRNLIVSVGSMDVLPAGDLTPGYDINPETLEELLAFARRSYSAICIDLPGTFESSSVLVMSNARQIYLVCTQEVTSLHLARMKINALQELGLKDRVAVLLNRIDPKHSLSATEVEGLLGAPVKYSFPNDYRRLNVAVEKGIGVEESSELGQHFNMFARAMAGVPVERAQHQQRKFLEFFTVTPSKIRLSRRTSNS